MAAPRLMTAAPRLMTSALAAAVLTLTACSASTPAGTSEITGVAGEGAGTAPPSGTPASPQPTVAALTPEAYRGELEKIQKTVRDSLDDLASARTVKSLDQRVSRAEEELTGAADGLAALTPPPEVAVQHERFVAGLRDLAAELGAATGKVATRDLCTGSALVSDVGSKLKELDAAGQALQDAGGYPADVVAVKAAGKQNRRLPNGRFLRKESLTGRSSLQIDNGSSRDAVVTLMRGGTKAFTVYVRKKSKFKVRGVRDGSYRVYFTHGVDWDGRLRAFTRQCSFERFDDKVKFKTTYTATRILWHDWRITLHAITGGNARTSDVDPGDFPG
ncbi:hypothetical protein [Thermoactinospora rubra]|uniref:hypothetical protein n=1 Tax=Thermoactinospora rubra TaxID=1088767 RepID=UPI00117D070E|nr:hypothetical protein [Thermoactinospora rubra]